MSEGSELPGAWQASFTSIRELSSFRSHQCEWIAETDSTNDDLRSEWEQPLPKPRLRVAEHQRRGRGQFDRCWLDVAGKSLLFSFSWALTAHDDHRLPLSCLAGIALWQALGQLIPHVSPSSWYLKWPNDLWNEQGKIGGILVESSGSGSQFDAIIGIGVNLSQVPILPGPVTGQLARAAAVDVSRYALLVAFCRQWDHLSRVRWSELITAYRSATSGMVGRRFDFHLPDTTSVSGTVRAIDDEGALIIEDRVGARRVIRSLAQSPEEKETGRS
ncbi:MAG TPA: biotin--[acetyl-CoA-carboxylase] ligase [Candidatus Ozemobacteraceae bacterium]|mgnify:CR=1 FL=1|nr:biotin--[acetyl-CoA-carboxylase] ligase [Candidatus Ozemobacteraceae bacterium]